MYAVIQTGGKQYKVTLGDVIDIERLDNGDSKEDIVFDNILLCSKDDKVLVGQPVVKGAKVIAQLLKELRGKKITTYKYKRRKNYHRTIGHRQNLTRVRIKEIIAE